MQKGIIIILVPAPTARGGISNYYQVLRNEFGEEVEYFERGTRTWPVHDTKIREITRFLNDYRKFYKRIRQGDIALVQSTTSLSMQTTIRDGIFLLIARLSGCKTIVYFRGWDYHAEQAIGSRLGIFNFFFAKSDAAIVLSERAKQSLIQWGYANPVYLETTLVDKHLIDNVDVQTIESKYIRLKTAKNINILYLSRIERRKGVFELLRAFSKLGSATNHGFRFQLNICGDGLAEDDLQQEVRGLGLDNIKLSGHVVGHEKIKVYSSAHIFVFPSYGEGMPNAVLEAMAFGLPVICTPVGGLVDFFIDEVHGKIVPIGDEHAILKAIQALCSNTEKLFSTAVNNHLYAVERFRSDIVGERIKNIFKEVTRK